MLETYMMPLNSPMLRVWRRSLAWMPYWFGGFEFGIETLLDAEDAEKMMVLGMGSAQRDLIEWRINRDNASRLFGRNLSAVPAL